MRWVKFALAVVAVFAASVAAFGLAAGLSSDVTAGVRDRPFIYWLMAAAMIGGGVVLLPELVSWFVGLDLPSWHRTLIERENRGTSMRLPAGTSMSDTARALEPGLRPRLAGGIVLYGFMYVVMSIPLPLIFGVGALRSRSLGMEETVPLIAALAVPIIWTLVLAVRRFGTTRAANDHGGTTEA